MLVLSRKQDETILIGDNIVITLLETGSGRVRVGIDAPSEIRIIRGELTPRIDQEFDRSLNNSLTHNASAAGNPTNGLATFAGAHAKPR